jgi:hypothetical protein
MREALAYEPMTVLPARRCFGCRAGAAAPFVDNLEHDGGFMNLACSVCSPPYDAIRAEPVWKAFLARHQMRECPYTSPEVPRSMRSTRQPS